MIWINFMVGTYEGTASVKISVHRTIHPSILTYIQTDIEPFFHIIKKKNIHPSSRFVMKTFIFNFPDDGQKRIGLGCVVLNKYPNEK